MYEHNALGYWSGLALCLTKIRSSRARCPATALIVSGVLPFLPNLLVGASHVICNDLEREVILNKKNNSDNHSY